MSHVSKKILIYRLGSLGDTVMALPCFHKIKDSFPDSDITLLTNKPVMAKAAPLEAVLDKGYFFHRTLSYPVGVRDPRIIARLLRQLRALKIDTVINITALRSQQADRRDKLFFKAAGINNFVGFDSEKEDFKIALDPETNQLEWEAKRLTKKIRSLGDIDLHDNKYWDLRLSEFEKKEADTVLGVYTNSDKILAINVGTKMPVKDWGMANWTSLLKSLSTKLPDHVLAVVGAADESALAEKCIEVWNGNSVDLCGKTTPRVSAAVLAKAALYIGHDSGPMHLAACVGTPCIGIFSCINQPKQWFPRGEINRVIMPKMMCGAHLLKNKECQNDKGLCITFTTPSEIEKTVLEMCSKELVN